MHRNIYLFIYLFILFFSVVLTVLFSSLTDHGLVFATNARNKLGSIKTFMRIECTEHLTSQRRDPR